MKTLPYVASFCVSVLVAVVAIACGDGEDEIGGSQSPISGGAGAAGTAGKGGGVCGAGQVPVLGQREAGGCVEDQPQHMGCAAPADADRSYCGRKEGRLWWLTAKPQSVGFEPCAEGELVHPVACGFQGCSQGSIESTCSPADTCAKVAPTCGSALSHTDVSGCFLEQCTDGDCPVGSRCAAPGETGTDRIYCAYRSDGQCSCDWLTSFYPNMRFCVPN